MTLDQTRYLDDEMSKAIRRCRFLEMDEHDMIESIRRTMGYAYQQVRDAIRLGVNNPADLN